MGIVDDLKDKINEAANKNDKVEEVGDSGVQVEESTEEVVEDTAPILEERAEYNCSRCSGEGLEYDSRKVAILCTTCGGTGKV